MNSNLVMFPFAERLRQIYDGVALDGASILTRARLRMLAESAPRPDNVTDLAAVREQRASESELV